MNLLNETTQNKLNDLLEKAYDAEKGFLKATSNTNDLRVKSFLAKQAQERKSYISDLESALTQSGMEVKEHDGSITGTLHRAWMDTKAFLSIDNDESVLEEVKRGEKAAIEDYDDVLNNCELNASVRDVLLKQKVAIQNSYDKADYLEDIKDLDLD